MQWKFCHRTDKYEGIYKYLVETSDSLSFNNEHEEIAEQRLEMEVTGPISAAFPAAPVGLVPEPRSKRSNKTSKASAKSSSDEDGSDDDGMVDEVTEESGDDDEHTVSRQSKRRRDGASGGASKKPKHEDAHEIPEDCFCQSFFNMYMFKIVQVNHCCLKCYPTLISEFKFLFRVQPFRTSTTLMRFSNRFSSPRSKWIACCSS